MKTLRLNIQRGVALPGGVNALPGETHEVEERFARSLLFDGRAIPATDVLAPLGEEPQPEDPEEAGAEGGETPEAESESEAGEEPQPEDLPGAPQDRDPLPINRDPSRRAPRRGPRR